MFTDEIKNFDFGNYSNLAEDSGFIYWAKSECSLIVQFFPKHVLLLKDDDELKLDYNELAAIAIKRNGLKISVVLNEKKISYDVGKDEKADGEVEFLKSLRQSFYNGAESSPYENVRVLCEENEILFDGQYNKYLYHLLLEYSSYFDLMQESYAIPENCSVEYILEEHTAKLSENITGTVGSLALSYLTGDLKGALLGAGMKMAKSLGNEIIGNCGILVLTNENAVYLKGNNAEVIETLDEVFDSLEVHRDETLRGAMDIFYEGIKILDNVSTALWTEFGNVLRKIKNQPRKKIAHALAEKVAKLEKRTIENTEKDENSMIDKGVALILCLVCGTFGAHRLYCKRTISGIFMMFLTLIMCFIVTAYFDVDFVFALIPSGIISIIDFILIITNHFKDGAGQYVH